MTGVVRTFRSAVTGRPKGLHYVPLIVIAVLAASSIAAAAENPLLEAAERGNRAAALQLLAKGADPECGRARRDHGHHAGSVER